MIGELPLPEHLVKFLTFLYRLRPGEPLDIDQPTPVGYLLRAVLLINRVPGYDIDYDILEESYAGSLTFTTQHSGITYDNLAVPNILVRQVVQLLYYHFYEELLLRSRAGAEHGKDYTAIRDEFFDAADLHDCIDYEAVIKSFYRHRLRKTQRPVFAGRRRSGQLSLF